MISYILYPHFPSASIPKRKGPGVPVARGGFGIYLTKGETLGKLELHKT